MRCVCACTCILGIHAHPSILRVSLESSGEPPAVPHLSSPVPWCLLQFSCAAPTQSSCPEPMPEVWVCNSDGYVGQVCLLSLRAEPDVEACIAVCSARILCIGAVPGLQRRGHR